MNERNEVKRNEMKWNGMERNEWTNERMNEWTNGSKKQCQKNTTENKGKTYEPQEHVFVFLSGQFLLFFVSQFSNLNGQNAS